MSSSFLRKFKHKTTLMSTEGAFGLVKNSNRNVVDKSLKAQQRN